VQNFIRNIHLAGGPLGGDDGAGTGCGCPRGLLFPPLSHIKLTQTLQGLQDRRQTSQPESLPWVVGFRRIVIQDRVRKSHMVLVALSN